MLRQLDNLAAREQQMYERNTDKDQVITVCTVALANLGMWTQNDDVPADYRHATWQRLAPFFHLSGQVTSERRTVQVALGTFNDRQLTRDRHARCERVTQAAPRLPGGRQLVMMVAPLPACIADLRRRCCGARPCLICLARATAARLTASCALMWARSNTGPT